ncbi:MAG: hemin uptake protein HemP [Gammaproteobacteria bacterium]
MFDKNKTSKANDNDNDVHRLYSAELFANAKIVVIEHEGADYRLRVTSNGKLILTK